jgi:putative phosphoesterase
MMAAPKLPHSPPAAAARRIGILSDTHGLFPPTLNTIFKGVDRILHAGDIDAPEVIENLCRIAPVACVRGNMDVGPWASKLAPMEIIEAGPIRIFMLHDLAHLDLSPEAADLQVVVYGHTHRPAAQVREGVLFLNPGSATYPRGGSPTVVLLQIDGTVLRHHFVSLVG